MLVGCGGNARPTVPATGPVAALPADSVWGVAWARPGPSLALLPGPLGRLRPLFQRLDGTQGVLASLVAKASAGPRWFGVAEFPDAASARSFRAGFQVPGGHRLVFDQARGTLRPDSTGIVSGRLTERAWFRRSLADLGGVAGRTAMFCDLRELARAERGRPVGATAFDLHALRRIPGVSSFLSIAVVLESHASKADRLRASIGLARTPVGIAKAIDLPPGPLRLPQLIDPAGLDAWWVQRLDVSSLVGALRLVASGTGMGVFGPDASQVLAMFGGGFLFDPKLWATLGQEWAGVVRSAARPTVCVLVSVQARAALMRLIDGIVADPPLRWSLRKSEIPGGTRLDLRWRGRRFVVVVGSRFAALGSRSERDWLVALVTGESSAAARARLTVRGAPESLNGMARLGPALTQRFLGTSGSAEAWMIRSPNGFLFRVRLEQGR